MRYPSVWPASVAALAVLGSVALAQTNSGSQNSETKPAPSQSPEQQQGHDEYLRSMSGRNGKQEPSAGVPQGQDDKAPFVNGNWNVPGAPADSQTVPAKFSKHNEALDKIPIVAARTMLLTDEQKQKISAAVHGTNPSIAASEYKVTGELPIEIGLAEFSPTLQQEIPGLRSLKYVRLKDRILLVDPPNRIVVGEIKDEK